MKQVEQSLLLQRYIPCKHLFDHRVPAVTGNKAGRAQVQASGSRAAAVVVLTGEPGWATECY